MNHYSTEILPMRAGLIHTRNKSLEIWRSYGEGILLISGLQGTGKNTLVDIFTDTYMGWSLPHDKVFGEHEVQYRTTREDYPDSVDTHLLNGIFPRQHKGHLFIAGIAGALDVQEAFGKDPRLFVVHLYCNPATRLLNILKRRIKSIQDGPRGEPLNDFVKNITSTFWSEVFPLTEISTRVTGTKPNIVINTSIGARINPAEARQTLLIG